MARVTQGVGALLVVVGVVAYLVSDGASPTALIPAVLGLVIGGLGLLATREPLRRHAIHGALVVALLGLLGTLPRVGGLGEVLAGEAERPIAVIASTVTAAALLVYVVLGVRSFVAARRSPAAR